MKSIWNKITSWLSDVTDMLPDWKGPIDKDRTILYASGQAVMQGFQDGMQSVWESRITPWLSKAAPSIAAALAPGSGNAATVVGSYGNPGLVIGAQVGTQLTGDEWAKVLDDMYGVNPMGGGADFITPGSWAATTATPGISSQPPASKRNNPFDVVHGGDRAVELPGGGVTSSGMADAKNAPQWSFGGPVIIVNGDVLGMDSLQEKLNDTRTVGAYGG
jgi:hypothetical protein